MVAQEDLDALHTAAASAAPELAAEALARDQPGEELLLSSATISRQDDAFDHKAGEDAEEISLRSTLTVDVLTFDGAAARAEYERILAGRLNGDAPEGFVVAPEEIVFEGPTETEESDRGVRLEVKARWRPVGEKVGLSLLPSPLVSDFVLRVAKSKILMS